jgi:hypothetical protein
MGKKQRPAITIADSIGKVLESKKSFPKNLEQSSPAQYFCSGIQYGQPVYKKIKCKQSF